MTQAAAPSSTPLPQPPLFKWAGGKRRLAARILAAFPQGTETTPWHEPYLGSGAVALAAHAAGARTGVLGDLGLGLMNAHRHVVHNPDEFSRAIDDRPWDATWRASYAEIRDRYNAAPASTTLARAADFAWLNRAAFNGLYRENRAGHFNVPPGSYTTLARPSLDAIRSVSAALAGFVLRVEDGASIVRKACSGERVYADPPYDPLSETASFTGYGSLPFGWEDQVALATACADAVERGVHVVASNHGTDRIRDLWEGLGFRVEPVDGVSRSIGCVGARRGVRVPEVLLVGVS